MVLNAFGSPHDLKRLAEISATLIRYGFGDLVQRFGLENAASKAGRILRGKEAPDTAHLSPAERLRCVLEEMGPTFVKLGQILSTRIDMLPPDYIAELETLHDKVATLPYEALVAEVEADLGYRLTEVFAEIDKTPLAAGSIAQVHRARLLSGEAVVLKIRRPGVRRVIEADLRLLMHIAHFVAAEFEDAHRFRPEEIITEFAKSIRTELDLANECHNAERIANNFRDVPHIRVPRVYWDWTNEAMNVQEFVSGIAGSDLTAARAAGLDLRLIAARGAEAVLTMMLEDRFFHADPHPGNVFYLPDEQLVFIDFGMVGHLSRRRRDELVDLLSGVVQRDPEAVTEILLKWANASLTENQQLEERIEGFIERVHGVPLKSLNLSALALDLVGIMREHDLALPPDLTLLIKAFTSLEGMGRQLDPDFDMASAAEPFLHRLILQRFSPKELVRLTGKGLADGVDLMAHLPKDLKTLIHSVQQGKIKLGIEVQQMDNFLTRLDRSITRITIGIVIAALTMGSSIVMTVSGIELPVAVSVFAMMGFFGAVVGGVWLMYSIWRSGKG
ncbi:AarF/UbiB family protein [Thalassovita taeanensis]|uniref:2-octaprenylphenol hydroxylase n=1 Tax=Thalassovita taeanensis TaxID=657014 RepID=A0A1H9EZV7_9RHOB|nr:AarF/UbiB family protein [Thalassovita taeanensis]SEQ31175.1 2-octaprenylphenol hydroxylase [Thalassovita taeanensis]